METTTASPLPAAEESGPAFKLQQVLTITSAHFVNDTYTGFIPISLPVLMEKLSLSLTLVGTVTAVMQLPAILNPLIG